MIAPYVPHISEAIYQEYFAQFYNTKSIHIQEYPSTTTQENQHHQAMQDIKEIISQVR